MRYDCSILNYSGSPDKVLCVRLKALIVDHRSSNEGDLWVPLETKPHNSLRFLAQSFIQLLELQEATVLRLVTVPYKSFGQRYVIYTLPSTGFEIRGIQVVNHYQEQYLAKFCSLGNAGCYWEPVGGQAS